MTIQFVLPWELAEHWALEEDMQSLQIGTFVLTQIRQEVAKRVKRSKGIKVTDDGKN